MTCRNEKLIFDFFALFETKLRSIFAFLFFVSGGCIQIGTERHRNASRIASNAKNDKFTVRIPFGVYFGVLRAFGAIFNFSQKKERRKTPRKCKKTKKAWQLPTFPPKGSIIGVRELDFRVRYGNGYYLSTMATRHLLHCKMLLYQAKKQATTQLKDE